MEGAHQPVATPNTTMEEGHQPLATLNSSMEGARQPVATRSGKLSDDTIFQADYDDLMRMIWSLTQEREQLQEEIDSTKMEVDNWIQMLGCSTPFQLEEFNTSTFTTLSPPQKTLLCDFHLLTTHLDTLDLLEGVKAYPTKEGELLIKFPWRQPSKPKHQAFLLLLTPGPEHTYSIQHHNLPKTVPMDQLENDYLKRPQGPEGLKRFVTVLGQYTRAIHERLQQIMAVEKAEYVLNKVYHNHGVTNLSFIVEVKEGREKPTAKIEFALKYHPLDILPHTTTADILSVEGKELGPETRRSVQGIAEDMKSAMFPQVLMAMIGSSTVESGITTHRESDEDATTEPLFDLPHH